MTGSLHPGCGFLPATIYSFWPSLTLASQLPSYLNPTHTPTPPKSNPTGGPPTSAARPTAPASMGVQSSDMGVTPQPHCCLDTVSRQAAEKGAGGQGAPCRGQSASTWLCKQGPPSCPAPCWKYSDSIRPSSAAKGSSPQPQPSPTQERNAADALLESHGRRFSITGL